MSNLIKVCVLSIFAISAGFSQVLDDSDGIYHLGEGAQFKLKKDIVIKAHTVMTEVLNITTDHSNENGDPVQFKHECYLAHRSSSNARVLKEDKILEFTPLLPSNNNDLIIRFNGYVSPKSKQTEKPALQFVCLSYRKEFGQDSFEEFKYGYASDKSMRLGTLKEITDEVFEITEAEPIDF